MPLFTCAGASILPRQVARQWQLRQVTVGGDPALAGQPPIYTRPVWGKVPGRGQPAGTATPPLDLERDAFGDRAGVPSLAGPSRSEPRGHGLGRGQGGSGFRRVKTRWVGLAPPVGGPFCTPRADPQHLKLRSPSGQTPPCPCPTRSSCQAWQGGLLAAPTPLTPTLLRAQLGRGPRTQNAGSPGQLPSHRDGHSPWGRPAAWVSRWHLGTLGTRLRLPVRHRGRCGPHHLQR